MKRMRAVTAAVSMFLAMNAVPEWTASAAEIAAERAALTAKPEELADGNDANRAEGGGAEWTAGPGEDYRIGPHDLLDIQVFQAELLSRKVRVSAKGMISLPLVGVIKASGLTPMELERAIAARLEGEYMNDPQVSVFVLEYTSQRVTVEGFVKKPGIYEIKGKTSLLQVLAMGQGVETVADAGSVRLFREEGGEKRMYTFNLDDIRKGITADPLVRGDDIVVVDKSDSKAFIKGLTDTLRGFIGLNF